MERHILAEIEIIKSQMILYRLPITTRVEVEKIAVNYLKVADLNQLRDKFEGVEYLKKLTKRVYALKALEKYYNKKLVDWGNVYKRPNILFDRTTLSNINIEIATFDYEKLPSIFNDFKYPVICILIRGNAVYIAGKLTEKDFYNSTNFIDAMRLGREDKRSKLLYKISCLTKIDD